MKPQSLTLFVIFILMLTQISIAQNIITIKNGDIKYNSPIVYLTNDRVFYIDTISKKEASFSKKDIKSVLFSNGNQISYEYLYVNSEARKKYTCTINLRNESFLTAKIIRITEDSVIYISPLGDENLYLATWEISQINYLNNLKEKYYINESLVRTAPAVIPKTKKQDSVIMKSEKPKTAYVETKVPNIKNSAILYVGATAGYVNAWTDNFGHNYTSENRKSVSPGFIAYYEYIDYASFSFGMLYAPKGVRLAGDTIDLKLNLSYLQFPLAFQVQSSGNKFKLFGEAGAYVGFLLSAKTILNTPLTKNEKNIAPELQHLEFGVLTGFGTKCFFKNACLSVGFRYDLSLTSIGGFTKYASGSNTYFISGNANRNYNIYAAYSINIESLKK